MADALSLSIKDLQAFYGDSHVLHGVSLDVAAGEVVTIIGRNGAGKTTTLRAVMGMLERRTGSITLGGKEVIGAAPERIARLGVAYVPEERGIYATLDVTENLMLPRKVNDRGMSLERIYKLFPNLYERRGSQGTRLSGGRGSISGTIVGTLIIGVLTNMLRLNNVDSNVEMMIKAVIIVLAVAVQRERTS